MNKNRVPTKVEYKNASENSGYHAIKLNNTQTKENKPKYREHHLVQPAMWPKCQKTFPELAGLSFSKI